MKFKLMVILAFILPGMMATAQTSTGKGLELKIKTSAQCDMCKERIEKAMAYEKGVYESTLNVEDKVLTLRYNPKKTSPEKLRTAVNKTGYDADESKADLKAYNKLPDCCKKPEDRHVHSDGCEHGKE